MSTELPRNTIYKTVQKLASGIIFCNTLYISATPSFVKIMVNKTPVNASTVPTFESQLFIQTFILSSEAFAYSICSSVSNVSAIVVPVIVAIPFTIFCLSNSFIIATSSHLSRSFLDRCLLLTMERCVILLEQRREHPLPVYHHLGNPNSFLMALYLLNINVNTIGMPIPITTYITLPYSKAPFQ
ncbi:hypothetical protein I568_01922 [Enterococcus columbae DSM 7374 = ATCC 51263]|uniref:Uncharacterized protein n=1 Tax=Enterococcus columbae DSM 7374 = ATCC 51263 TaxID=1121865 RepID=S1MTR8_9ENTE|nr:hypothetical protein OMW_01308 [Enterococcus columbae DSM 7374 = ATCC 51263]EOW80222.1 hypothetical protein I568_01922 [Enterococcus columbae DSM 7374 = ATCC 51263]